MKSAYKEIVRPVPNGNSVFIYLETGKGKVLPSWKNDRHALVFVLSGQLKLSSAGGTVQRIPAGHFTLLPKSADREAGTAHDTRLLVLLFNRVDHAWTAAKIKKLLDAPAEPAVAGYASLTANRALVTFLNLLVLYVEEKEIDRSFYAAKDSELLSLLYAFYLPEELGNLFYPVLHTNPDFKSFVEANYLKVESAAGLAELMGYSQVTLNRKFKEYYQETAYQWIIRNKKKMVKKRLQSSTVPLSEIAKEFGFYSGSELNRFCQRQFGVSALKIRKGAAAGEGTKP